MAAPFDAAATISLLHKPEHQKLSFALAPTFAASTFSKLSSGYSKSGNNREAATLWAVHQSTDVRNFACAHATAATLGHLSVDITHASVDRITKSRSVNLVL
jgi:hypothetical protein